MCLVCGHTDAQGPTVLDSLAWLHARAIVSCGYPEAAVVADRVTLVRRPPIADPRY
jgi:hypothetical protein